MEYYESEAQYLKDLDKRSGLPEGFLVSTAFVNFIPEEKPVDEKLSMNLTLIKLKEPSECFGAVYTKNAFPGAPVILGRKRLNNRFIRGILINNRIANVSARNGEEDAERILKELAELLGGSSQDYIPASTGIIGWKLPVEEIVKALPGLAVNLRGGSVLSAAKAIMTTDSFPKVRREKVGDGTVVGIAKGAGMIEPNMGTMLAFIFTDLYLDREEMRKILKKSVNRTFNRISIDGDQSTSDTAVLVSSGKKKAADFSELERAVEEVCRKLAEDIVRNGEGVGHVMEVAVKRAPSEEVAVNIGKAVINSPLVKTAVFGNDPNVGRLLSSVGDYCGTNLPELSLRNLRINLGGIEVFSNRFFRLDTEKERRLADYLKNCGFNPALHGYPVHDKKVEIVIDLCEGTENAKVLGSDLSYQYVKENADYRS
ncbi:MAG: bifunctional glutamate N-acetyltransferase/amino-acid acetyltransferase ArgJ [Spirochaetales bacterium]|nr:bifunctional glutamate N-acetyltransferase/amino-acid acetyltransferase ArgJ [Spirochaetales bacterium]